MMEYGRTPGAPPEGADGPPGSSAGSPERASGSGRASRIAYLGPPGTFSEEALLGAGLAEQLEPIASATIAEAIAAVERREVDAAFLPIENSIEGSVNVTLDELVFSSTLLIQAEVVVDVHLALMAVPGTTPAEITEVLSFPVATAQCRSFLASRLPDARVGAASSTAEAARLVAEAGARSTAAVAPALAAQLYGLEILGQAIEDHEGNKTRFVLVAPDRVPPPTGLDKTTVVCFQHSDRPGSLHQIIGQFAARSLNLTRIESRPTKQALGDYCFVIDVEGHVADEVLGDCLRELHLLLEDVKFLGSYPAAGSTSKASAEIGAARRSAEGWLASLRRKVGAGPGL